MKNILNYGIIALLIIIIQGCGEDSMSHIGEEITSTLADTNVTDDTQYYDTTKISLSAHLAYSTLIVKDGGLWGTGENIHGQLGLGATTYFNTFTDTGVTNVQSVSMGQWIAFIIKTDGTLWATGNNEDGQLGIGSNNDVNIFTATGVENVKSVLCGNFNTYIIKKDGTLWEIKSNTFIDTGITDVKFASVGNGHILIIKNDGTLWGRGSNSKGQLGVGDNIDRDTFTDTGITDIRSVVCGGFFTLIIKNNGTLWSTGDNALGELGLGDNTDRNVFTNTSVSSLKNVSAGSVHSIITKTDDTLWSTGYNSEGELGLGDNTDRNVFTNTGVTSVRFAEAGRLHSMIVKTDDTLWGTGRNFEGELGLGDNLNKNTFTDTTKTTDTFVPENWTPFYQSDIVRINDYRYTISLPTEETPNIFTTLTKIGAVNELKPFDNQNITPAISSSPMTYTITGTEEFNAFTLAKVLATNVTYTFKNSLGATIKTDSVAIDVKRDKDGILSDYPTTVVFYADTQMEAGSTVEISLTYSGDIELGDFTLNNSIEAGFTNNKFTIGIKDFNDYTPDDWGNIPKSVKAVVATFDISMDIYFENLSSMASFQESVAGKNVTVDGSDGTIDALTKRVRVTNPTISSEEKDNEVGRMALFKFRAQEIA